MAVARVGGGMRDTNGSLLTACSSVKGQDYVLPLRGSAGGTGAQLGSLLRAGRRWGVCGTGSFVRVGRGVGGGFEPWSRDFRGCNHGWAVFACGRWGWGGEGTSTGRGGWALQPEYGQGRALLVSGCVEQRGGGEGGGWGGPHWTCLVCLVELVSTSA